MKIWIHKAKHQGSGWYHYFWPSQLNSVTCKEGEPKIYKWLWWGFTFKQRKVSVKEVRDFSGELTHIASRPGVDSKPFPSNPGKELTTSPGLTQLIRNWDRHRLLVDRRQQELVDSIEDQKDAGVKLAEYMIPEDAKHGETFNVWDGNNVLEVKWLPDEQIKAVVSWRNGKKRYGVNEMGKVEPIVE